MASSGLSKHYNGLLSYVVLRSASKTRLSISVRNPFEQQQANPFQTARSPKPAMNQLLSGGGNSAWQPQPAQPARAQPQDFNPFF